MENLEDPEETKQQAKRIRQSIELNNISMEELLAKVKIEYELSKEELNKIEPLRDQMRNMQNELEEKAKNEGFDGSLLIRFLKI
jgi:hypothetical protein